MFCCLPLTDIPRSILNQLAQGIEQHGLCKCVITLANELNVKAMHHIKQGPKSKWFFRMFDCWLKERRKDVSLLALLSAIVRIRRMGILVTEVAKELGLLCPCPSKFHSLHIHTF